MSVLAIPKPRPARVDTIKIRIRFAGMSRHLPGVDAGWREQTAPSDATVGSVLGGYGLQHEAEVSVLVNGLAVEWSHILQQGDEVVVVPPLVGG